jgi:hypothetical protein
VPHTHREGLAPAALTVNGAMTRYRDRHQSRTSRQNRYDKTTGRATIVTYIPVTPKNASGMLIVKPTAAQSARASAVLTGVGPECTRAS